MSFVSVISATVPGGSSAVFAHGITVDGVATAPQTVYPDRSTALVVSAVTSTSITVTNPDGVAHTAVFWCVFWHSIQNTPAQIAPGVAWQGSSAATGAAIPPVEIVVAVSPVNVPSSNAEIIVLVDVVPCTVNLPAIVDGRGKIIVKDRTGNATAQNPITIAPAAGETFDGQSSLQIASGYRSYVLYGNNTEWSIL